MMALGLVMATSIIVAVISVIGYFFNIFSVQVPILVGTILFGVLVNLFGVILSVEVEEKRNEKTQSN
jgi:hypothetical protein